MNAPDKIAAELGRLIRRAADDQGMSMVELSTKSGIPRGSLYRYLDGDREMRLSDIGAVARVLGVDAGTLVHDAIQGASRSA